MFTGGRRAIEIEEHREILIKNRPGNVKKDNRTRANHLGDFYKQSGKSRGITDLTFRADAYYRIVEIEEGARRNAFSVR